MSTILIDGLDSRTTGDIVQNYCQTYGRVLNCYVKAGQSTVTFAEKFSAEEFVRCSPHRIDSAGLVRATSKAVSNRPDLPRSINQSTDTSRLTVRGTFEQLEEKSLVQYFSRYGTVRMCLSNRSQGFASITFDNRSSYECALREARHFLHGRSLTVEPSTSSSEESESNKRMKFSHPNETTASTRFEEERGQFINEQIRLQHQYQERLHACEYENQYLKECITKRHTEYQQQIVHYQYLLQQSLDAITKKDQQIEQVKQENKDIDDLLRQSVHDNEQQQIHLKKREEVHNQTKRKYEELYKAYIKLKDNSTTPHDREKESKNPEPKSTLDNVRKKL